MASYGKKITKDNSYFINYMCYNVFSFWCI